MICVKGVKLFIFGFIFDRKSTINLHFSGENGYCQPASICPFVTPEDLKAGICTNKNTHVCCKDVLKNEDETFNSIKDSIDTKNEENVPLPEGILDAGEFETLLFFCRLSYL